MVKELLQNRRTGITRYDGCAIVGDKDFRHQRLALNRDLVHLCGNRRTLDAKSKNHCQGQECQPKQSDDDVLVECAVWGTE